MPWKDFTQVLVLAWLPAGFGYVVGGELWRFGVIATLALYGVVLTGLKEDIE